MPKKTKKEEDGDIKRFKAFVTTVLGKKGAKVFVQNNAIWEEKIEKDEPVLENFVLKGGFCSLCGGVGRSLSSGFLLFPG